MAIIGPALGYCFVSGELVLAELNHCGCLCYFMHSNFILKKCDPINLFILAICLITMTLCKCFAYFCMTIHDFCTADQGHGVSYN